MVRIFAKTIIVLKGTTVSLRAHLPTTNTHAYKILVNTNTAILFWDSALLNSLLTTMSLTEHE